MEAIITYRPDAQKTPGLFDMVLTREVLLDICQLVQPIRYGGFARTKDRRESESKGLIG